MDSTIFANGRLAVTPGEALYYAGRGSSIEAAQKTARNLMCIGKYPFPVQSVGGKKVVLVRDIKMALGLFDVQVEQKAMPLGDPQHSKRRPGRPRKIGNM